MKGNRTFLPKCPSALETSLHFTICPEVSSIHVSLPLKDKENAPGNLEIAGRLRASMEISFVGLFSIVSWRSGLLARNGGGGHRKWNAGSRWRFQVGLGCGENSEQPERRLLEEMWGSGVVRRGRGYWTGGQVGGANRWEKCWWGKTQHPMSPFEHFSHNQLGSWQFLPEEKESLKMNLTYRESEPLSFPNFSLSRGI